MGHKQTQFVIQKHIQGDNTHWDLMLESEGILQTWRLYKCPEDVLSGPTRAEKIFNHQLKFLTYEGPVNNGQGEVIIADKGIYEILSCEKDKSIIEFKGHILNGNYCLNVTDDKRIFELFPTTF